MRHLNSLSNNAYSKKVKTHKTCSQFFNSSFPDEFPSKHHNDLPQEGYRVMNTHGGQQRQIKAGRLRPTRTKESKRD
jgi:hypothetical protein